MFACVLVIVVITASWKATSARPRHLWPGGAAGDITCVNRLPDTFTSSGGVWPLETAWIPILQMRRPRLTEATWLARDSVSKQQSQASKSNMLMPHPGLSTTFQSLLKEGPPTPSLPAEITYQVPLHPGILHLLAVAPA